MFRPRPYRSFLFSVVIVQLYISVFPAKTFSQLIYFKEKIYSPYTLKNDKAVVRKQKLLAQANSLDTLQYPQQDDEINTALWAVGQFLVKTDSSNRGIARLADQLPSMSSQTQRAFLEVLYGLYPGEYQKQLNLVCANPASEKSFVMAAANLMRDHDVSDKEIINKLSRAYPNWQNSALLTAFYNSINLETTREMPPLDSLLAHQQKHGFKMIYSFQHNDRNKPGFAVVQNADGSFAKDSIGNIKTFVQLARSASNLPWYIQNGNTPQGLFAITGTDISKNVFIGPTPNLQLAMPGEVNPPVFTHYFPIVYNAPPERLYRSYFPETWQQHEAIMQSFNAGKIGRSAIIAHGSTIDPEWFAGHPYYPLSPTLGCLSGLELWNGETGKISRSDQLDLVNTFIETAGTKGYLIMLEMDEYNKPFDHAELIRKLSLFEKNVLPGVEKYKPPVMEYNN